MSSSGAVFRFRNDGPAPGAVWRSLFDYHWPGYQLWFLRHGAGDRPSYGASRRAISDHMPEMLGLYDRVCEASGGSDLAARFLSMWCPPAYIAGCSQVLLDLEDGPALLRNYDFGPDFFEGTVLSTAWAGREVAGVSDCLWGLLDGVNGAGLAVSLSFGGRKIVGTGFGIPLILRYLLQAATTVGEAVEALRAVPSHMAYNIAMADRSGARMVAETGPGGVTLRPGAWFSLNHQDDRSWRGYLDFSATEAREAHLCGLGPGGATAHDWCRRFLSPPLYSTQYARSFGTLYTALYRPGAAGFSLIWPGRSVECSAARVPPQDLAIAYRGAG